MTKIPGPILAAAMELEPKMTARVSSSTATSSRDPANSGGKSTCATSLSTRVNPKTGITTLPKACRNRLTKGPTNALTASRSTVSEVNLMLDLKKAVK